MSSLKSFKVPDYFFSSAVNISTSPLFSSFWFLCLKNELLRGPRKIDYLFFSACSLQSILEFLCGTVLDMAELGCCCSCYLLSSFFLVASDSLPVTALGVDAASLVFLLK